MTDAIERSPTEGMVSVIDDECIQSWDARWTAMGRPSSIERNGVSLHIDDWPTLTLVQRADLCRRSADEASKSASAACPNMKEDYLKLAANWMQLAEEIEKSMGRSTFTSSGPPDRATLII